MKIGNTQIDVEYQPSQYEKGGKTIHHVVAKVGPAETLFTSLGLEVGQKELNEKQVKWFETHQHAVVEVLENLKLASKNTTVGQNLDVYRRAFRAKDLWLTRFCKECNIIDD